MENNELRSENKRLRNRIEVLEGSIDERINKVADAAPKKVTAPFIAMIAEKDKEILWLKSQLILILNKKPSIPSISFKNWMV